MGYGGKSISINVNVLTLIFYHFSSFYYFYRIKFLFILLVGDFILCRITLRFRLNHITSKRFLCNLYLVYYVLIPSTPLLLFLRVQYANKGSQKSNLTLTESLFVILVLFDNFKNFYCWYILLTYIYSDTSIYTLYVPIYFTIKYLVSTFPNGSNFRNGSFFSADLMYVVGISIIIILTV